MLDQLLQHLREEIAPKIEQNASLNKAQSQEAAEVTHQVVSDSLKENLLNGQGSSLISLLTGSGSQTANPVSNSITDKLISALSGRLGINESQARSVAGSVLPSVLGYLGNKFSQSGHENSVSGLTRFFNLHEDGGFMEQAKGLAEKIGLGGLFGGK